MYRLSLGTAVAGALTCGTWSLVRARVGDPTDRLADSWHEGHRVLDREGRIRASFSGEADWASPEARALIDALLAEPA